ncbi:MAG: 30S ribosomal protein S12 methylthiotransferase RimO [Deltaproteobacteria bacterium]|nr:30S ribosomal protein S12 methylthiotransferase RimO [Deltaproteobacteria bacterium]
MRERCFHIVGLGCPKNRVDSEIIWAQLAMAGWVAVDDPQQADLIVINTCAFIQAAVQESLDSIVDLGRLRSDPTARCSRLVVAGCLTARYGDDLAVELGEVDLFVGPAEVGAIAELVESGHTGVVYRAGAFLPDHRTPRANSLGVGAAYLKAAEGCSRGCSFCLIPRLRGPQRSRPIEDLVIEAESLVRLGVAEIVLVAQDLASWGRDLPGRPGLADLAAALADVAGLWWLRLMYLFPSRVPERLIQLIAEHDNVLAYLDLPLQHIDPQVLGAMRRGGSADGYRELVERVRSEIPGVVLRTTLMTGFPGETEAAFEHLCDFVRQVRFERLGVFAFSAEEGTEAAGLTDAVPAEIAHERRARLMDIQQPIAEAYHRSLIGSVQEVLVEGVQPGGGLVGRAWMQAPEVDGQTWLQGQATIGELVRARITDADAYDLAAEVLA